MPPTFYVFVIVVLAFSGLAGWGMAVVVRQWPWMEGERTERYAYWVVLAISLGPIIAYVESCWSGGQAIAQFVQYRPSRYDESDVRAVQRVVQIFQWGTAAWLASLYGLACALASWTPWAGVPLPSVAGATVHLGAYTWFADELNDRVDELVFPLPGDDLLLVISILTAGSQIAVATFVHQYQSS